MRIWVIGEGEEDDGGHGFAGFTGLLVGWFAGSLVLRRCGATFVRCCLRRMAMRLCCLIDAI